MKPALALLNAAVLALALTACGGRAETPRLQDTPPPTIQVSSTQTDNIETVQAMMRMEVHLEHLELTMSQPEAAAHYLYQNDQLTRTRADIPGNTFPDNLPRTILYDVTNDVGYSYVKRGSTYEPDSLLTSEDIATLNLGEHLQDANLSVKPMTTMSEQEFRLRAQTLNYRVQGAEQQLMAQSTSQDSTGEEEITLHYDPEVGAITKFEQVKTVDGQTQTSEGSVKFAQVPGMDNVIMPYEIKIRQTAPGHLSTQSADTDTLKVSPSEVDGSIPSGWSVTPYTPTLSTQSVEQTIRFNDIKVNMADPSVFWIGGQ